MTPFEQISRNVARHYANQVADSILKNSAVFRQLPLMQPVKERKLTPAQIARAKRYDKELCKARSAMNRILKKFPELRNELSPEMDDER